MKFHWMKTNVPIPHIVLWPDGSRQKTDLSQNPEIGAGIVLKLTVKSLIIKPLSESKHLRADVNRRGRNKDNAVLHSHNQTVDLKRTVISEKALEKAPVVP